MELFEHPLIDFNCTKSSYVFHLVGAAMECLIAKFLKFVIGCV